MRRVTFESKFERDSKRLKRHGKDVEQLLAVVKLLAQNGRLSHHYHPHKLSGTYAGLWECHIEFDWLLIYEIDEKEVRLFRTGSHDDLF